MKALLYKDACVLWKQMKFMLVIIAVFCLLPNSFGLNAFFVVYPGLMLPVSLMAYDERAHWDSFAAMLPYPPRALVLSRYAAGWLLTLLAGVLYLVGALIQDQGAPLGTALGTLGWVLAVVLLCQAILFPFFFRVGTEQGRLYMILLSVLLLLGGVGLTSLLNVAVPAVSTLLMLAPVGGLFAGHCERENVRVTTRGGRKYTGFIARTNASLHIQSEEELAAKADFTKNVEVVLDEDVQSEQDVRALGVRAGDFVALDPRYTVTDSGYIKSRFLDDKAAVAVLLAYARHLKRHKLTPSRAVWAHFSLHEEIGHGATGGLPEGLTEILAMDMGCVGSFTEAGEKKVSICAKDASFPYHYDVVTRLIETAEREGLCYGVDVYYPHYGSDANAALRAGLDLRHGLIGPGVYGCHDYERTHVEALKNTFLLLKAYFA